MRRRGGDFESARARKDFIHHSLFKDWEAKAQRLEGGLPRFHSEFLTGIGV